MPYISDNAMQTLDLFMTSIGRKRAWEVLKSKLGSGSGGEGGSCDNDGCAEAIAQTKINKANIKTNTTNITKNADTIAGIKTQLETQLDKANPADIDKWFND